MIAAAAEVVNTIAGRFMIISKFNLPLPRLLIVVSNALMLRSNAGLHKGEIARECVRLGFPQTISW
jgi:hypothetical protein